MQTDITDHHPVVSQFKHANLRQSHPVYTHKRFITQTTLDNFTVEILQVNWNNVLDKYCPNDAFSTFHEIFNILYQNHFFKEMFC